MPRFKPKSVEIDALRFNGENGEKIWEAFGEFGGLQVLSGIARFPTEVDYDVLVIRERWGDLVEVPHGTWVVPVGPKVPGRFYLFDNDVFTDSYEPVEED